MFKMKGLPGYLKSLAFFSLLFNIATAIVVQAITADELLDQKEKELTDFVAAVEANARNCDALEGCSSSEGGCSRLACFKYGTEGDRNYQCLDNIANNTGRCGSQCRQLNLDFSRGFVRRVDPVDAHVARTVCTHRTLDDLFKKSSISDSSHLCRVFFGAVDGTTRLYPGVDEDCDDDYDCRLRPWFIESTDVPKIITLIVDSGLSMHNKPPAANTSGETYLTHAKAMALKVLEKLQDSKDYANIRCIYGDGTVEPKNTKSEIYNSFLHQKFNVTLDAAIASTSTQDPNATDFGSAINAAMLEMDTSVPETYLKVVIVLTYGQFNISSPVNISPYSGIMNLFMYNFVTTDAAKACNTGIRASSEMIPVDRVNNPLYALESYFSFLAKVRQSFFGYQTDYGQKYADASGIDNNTLTIGKAAFGPNGELIGVVGIDFFQTKVDEQYDGLEFDLIVEAARKRHPTKSFNASAATLPSVCFNHTDACSNLPNTTAGLCGIKDGDAKIGCCGACKSKGKKTSWGAILGGTAGAVAGLFGVAIVLYCFRHCIARKLEKKPTSEDQPFSGSDDDTT